MVITPLLLAALGLHCLWERVGRLQGIGHWGSVVGLTALIVVSSLNLLLKDVVLLSDLEARNTCLLGVDLFKKLGIDEENTLVGHYTPLSPTWKRGFDFIASYRDPEAMKGKRYAAVASNLYSRYFQEPARYPNEVRFYNDLFTRPLVLDLKPEPLAERFAGFLDFINLMNACSGLREYFDRRHQLSVGPEIRVYRLDGGSTRL
jgi:hypothetical protein